MVIFALLVGVVYYDLGNKRVSANGLQNLITDRYCIAPGNCRQCVLRTSLISHASLPPSSPSSLPPSLLPRLSLSDLEPFSS